MNPRQSKALEALHALFLKRYAAAGKPPERAIEIMQGCEGELREARKAGRVDAFIAEHLDEEEPHEARAYGV